VDLPADQPPTARSTAPGRPNRFATDFLEVLRAERVIAILRSSSAQEAVSTGKELIRAGIRVLEVSLNTPGALEAIAELSASAARSQVLVGAGTVLDASSVAKAGEAGARFYVSPVLDEQAIAAANELGMAAVPGCATPTEMLAAHAAGATAIKVFPATLWNPDGLAERAPRNAVPATGADRRDRCRQCRGVAGRRLDRARHRLQPHRGGRQRSCPASGNISPHDRERFVIAAERITEPIAHHGEGCPRRGSARAALPAGVPRRRRRGGCATAEDVVADLALFDPVPVEVDQRHADTAPRGRSGSEVLGVSGADIWRLSQDMTRVVG